MSRSLWTMLLIATAFSHTSLLGCDLFDCELLAFKKAKNLNNSIFTGFYHVNQVTNVFTWTDFAFTKYCPDSSDVSIVDGIIEGNSDSPFVARVKIFICKDSSEAIDALLLDIVSCSAPIDLIIASHETTKVFGDVCIVPTRKKDRAYYTRGNVACSVNILSGEQSALDVLRNFDAYLSLSDSTK